MFEFHLESTPDPLDSPFIYKGSTTDFLEFCAQVTQFFNEEICGKFVESLMVNKLKELSYLRVIDFEFEFRLNEQDEKENKIILRKVK